MYTMKVIVRRNAVEILMTILLAFAFVLFYNSSPVLIFGGVIGLTIMVIILLKAPEYAVLLLVVILPFRDVHLISALHFKRFVIWSLLLYIMIRQITASRNSSSQNIFTFTKIVLFFVGIIIISLIKTASALYTTIAITPSMLKSTILSDALTAVEGILLFYIVYYLITTPRHIQKFIDVIIAVSAIIALLGILQYYAGGPPGFFHFLFDPEYKFYGRATSVFSNPNGLGGFLAPMMGITFVSLVWRDMDTKKRIFFIIPVLILDCWALLLSFSRGAMLQIFFCLIVSGYLYLTKICHRKISWKLILVVISISGLTLLTVQYYDIYLRTRLSSYKKEKDYHAALNWIKTKNDFQRKHAAIEALQTFIKHPVLGIGYNLFSGKSVAGFEYFGLAVHNQYLEVLAEMGILGFVPFIGLLWMIITTGIKLLKKDRLMPITQEGQIMILMLLTGISAIAFGFLFADSLPIISITGYLWMFSGALFVLERQYNEPMRET